MRIVVLNGVNLDELGRRDPAVYGGLTANELETRIYGWAKELGLTVACQQTNHEGEYVDWCHEALDWADGVIVNPGAWSHYSYAIHDALELFDRPDRGGAPVQRRRARGVAAALRRSPTLAATRIIGKGPDGYREALEYLRRRSDASASTGSASGSRSPSSSRRRPTSAT